MYRVVALGEWAGVVVDRLRENGFYDDIRFVFCDTDDRRLAAHGNKEDEHILLTNLARCSEAIHDDCELMAVLVVDLEEIAREYVIDIIYELWGYADYSYCFATGPELSEITEGVGKNAELFKWITDHSNNMTVFQDKSKLPVSFDRYNGMSQLLGLILHHPHKGKSNEREDVPFGVWATEKQLFTALQTVYSNHAQMQGYYNAGSFTFHKSTHEY